MSPRKPPRPAVKSSVTTALATEDVTDTAPPAAVTSSPAPAAAPVEQVVAVAEVTPPAAQAVATEAVETAAVAADVTAAAPSSDAPPAAGAVTAANLELTPPVIDDHAAPLVIDEPPAPAADSLPEINSPKSKSQQKSKPTFELAAEPEPEQFFIPPEPVSLETPPEPAAQPPLHFHAQRPSLFIVHITPEMAPVAKVGGLADVVFGLSRELAIRGNHVEVILPKYDTLRYDHIFEMHRVYDDLWVPWYEGAVHCTVFFGFVHGRKCFFIEPHSQDNFFNRGSVYGFNDDVLRYAFFSRAAIEFLWKAGKHPDIIHCHDWQTALVPVFLYEFYQRLGMMHPRICLTIHNFKHQGVTGAELLRASGLHQPERFFDYNRMRDNHHPNALNLLKAGIVYSNFITTVSPRHAFEAKEQGQGFGLEPTLHTHQTKYGGVVNGIDYDVWNPEVDLQIPARYGVSNIDAKYDNKRALRQRFMLADNEKPIVAFIGRLDPQKGLELVRHAIFYSLEHGAQFVLLGASPDHAINNDFWGLKRMLNDSPDCHVEIGFDDDLAHLIYAGSDMMLVPSRFEPCGLTQLIALRYGTIPVVRSIGGLADTVYDKDHSDRPLHERNGYRFDNYDALGLESALGRAIACYYEYPDHFRHLIENAMRADFSWNRPGEDYLNIYDFIRDR
ncbi:glycogen synthase GlgA [Thiospirillum jenense]|uniref:glycogen synthase n=1 Tax=Thiospirillum jenense TaxID=1653858 RepID=UPI0030B85064